MPGERRRRSAANRQRDGIPLDDTTWNEIVEVAEKLGVDPIV